ncbi:sulfatase family protein [Pontiella sulfatireligans]|uniref:Arylsulfatase n=1 Tax=Pontiella sulfatireligans TaxID=2750658 RepID=A0A6C2UEE0_9BACT|nr:arylsulfatase [Pontiella sulfatireligans]SPS74176.1 sulfatase S1_15 [Kiritimatiellales bacterium]VGO18478.1 Arylsulfatase [Pontiella sulfatireligans]
MKRFFLLCSAMLAISVVQAAKLPNVVVIYADDMGFGDLGANNPESKIPTPNLDQLADQGMRFTDGHSSSGICTPSRFALLTGQHHWRRFHGIVNAFGESVFEPDDFTLAKMFKSKGYNTAAVGKWHLGWNWDALKIDDTANTTVEQWGKKKKAYKPEAFDWSKPIPNGPLAQGFDYYFGDGTINFPPYCFVENDRVTEVPTVMMDTKLFKEIPEGNWEFRPGPMVEGWNPYKVLPTLADKAVAWIGKQKKEQPFFLYFAFPSPHAPIIPNDEYRGKSEAGPYGDFVVESDAMAGKIFQALEAGGFSKNTIVVFTADNGPEKYAYERQKKFGHWSSGPSRGLKRDVWEGGHRVPFVVSWPGKVKPGMVSDETVSQVDLATTFAKVIGYDMTSTEAVDSYNLLPVLEEKKYSQPLRKATVQNTFDKAFALRQGDWVYIDAKSGEHSKSPAWFNEERGYGKDATPGLLYNLKDDPAQHVNLYASHPEKVGEMKALLERYKGGEGCAPHAKNSNH